MTNTIALWLGLLIVGVIVVDILFLELGAVQTVLKLLIGAIDRIAVWR